MNVVEFNSIQVGKCSHNIENLKQRSKGHAWRITMNSLNREAPGAYSNQTQTPFLQQKRGSKTASRHIEEFAAGSNSPSVQGNLRRHLEVQYLV